MNKIIKTSEKQNTFLVKRNKGIPYEKCSNKNKFLVLIFTLLIFSSGLVGCTEKSKCVHFCVINYESGKVGQISSQLMEKNGFTPEETLELKESPFLLKK